MPSTFSTWATCELVTAMGEAMDDARAADMLGRVEPVNVAAILNVVSGELCRRLLLRFPVDFRNLVRRFML